MQSNHKTIFLDTNIFLHYRAFNEIDWLTLLGSSTLTIVLPPITLRELNKQKEVHPHQRIRERAAHVLKNLAALFAENNPGNIKPNVEVLLEDREPNIDFLEFGLQKEIQDDNLIASIISFQQSGSESDTILVTSDNGLLLIAKARRLHIGTVTLPDEFKLPAEIDAHQKRVKDLENEVIRLRSLTPVLALTFKDGNDFTSFAIAGPIEISANKLESQLATLRTKYPKMAKQIPPAGRGNLPPGELLNAFIQSMQLMGITDDAIEKYNTTLDDFFDEYKRYLEEDLIYKNEQRRTIELRIVLANDGTTPAEDIDIRFHIPNDLTLYKRGARNPPTAPTPPPHPTTDFMDLLRGSPQVLNYPFLERMIPPVPQPPRNVSSLKITKSKSYDIECHVTRLKHGMREAIDPFVVVFDNYESASSFNIECTILSGNIPEAIEQKLHVVIKKGSA